jgi:hypothetical protein
MLYFFHGTAGVVISHGIAKEREARPPFELIPSSLVFVVTQRCGYRLKEVTLRP